MANGYCYEAGGSVYFDTAAFSAAPTKRYGKLDPTKVAAGQAQGAAAVAAAEGGEGALSTDWTEGKTNAELLAEGEGALSAGAEADKRQPADFVLWKKSKVRENSRLLCSLPRLFRAQPWLAAPTPHPSVPFPLPARRWASQRGTPRGGVAGLAGTLSARRWPRTCSATRWTSVPRIVHNCPMHSPLRALAEPCAAFAAGGHQFGRRRPQVPPPREPDRAG